MREEFFRGLDYVRPLLFQDVFESWRESEGSSPHWLGVARARGFETWEEWRRSYFPPFRMEERSWWLYRVADPLRTVPRFLGGPFQGWIEHTYRDAGVSPPFSVISSRLTAGQQGYVDRLKTGFPKATTVIGVLTDDGVVIAEGTHRCSALASLAADGGAGPATDFRIALGSYLPGGVPIIPRVYRNVESV
jgi:hypothetical protein